MRNRARDWFPRADLVEALWSAMSQLPGSNTRALVNTLVNQPKCSQALMHSPPRPPLNNAFPPPASPTAVAASAPGAAPERARQLSRRTRVHEALREHLACCRTPCNSTLGGWNHLCCSILRSVSDREIRAPACRMQ